MAWWNAATGDYDKRRVFEERQAKRGLKRITITVPADQEDRFKAMAKEASEAIHPRNKRGSWRYS